jgi:hypothetical protein
MAKPTTPEHLSPLPTVRSARGATKFINEEFNVPLKFHYVRDAAQRGELPCKKIGQALYFTPVDLWKWVASL